MKRIIVLLGPNGVGKSTAAAGLLNLLPNSAYVESDSLRLTNIDAVRATELQRANILAVMRNYISSPEIDNIIFPYGLHGHRKLMLDEILGTLGGEYKFAVIKIILTCSEDENVRRMKLDRRGDDRISRALENTRSIYDNLDILRIDTTGLCAEQTAEWLFNIILHLIKTV